MAAKGVDLARVVLWIDWQSVSQDDPEMKHKAMMSLPAYIACCEYMIVPTRATGLQWPGPGPADEGDRGDSGGAGGAAAAAAAAAALPTLGGAAAGGDGALWAAPHDIPGYGSRAFCRLEALTFTLWARLQGRPSAVELYAASREGELRRYALGEGLGNGEHLPRGGLVTLTKKDRKRVERLEEIVLRAYTSAVVVRECERHGTPAPATPRASRESGTTPRASRESGTTPRASREGGGGGGGLIGTPRGGGGSARGPASWGGDASDGIVGGSAQGARLSSMGLQSSQAVTIAKAVQHFRVARLNLGCNALGPDSAELFGTLLRNPACALVRLALYDNGIGDEGGVTLASSLEANRTLTSLDVSTNELCERSGEAFVRLVRANATLARLDLRSNYLGKEAEGTLHGLLDNRVGFVLLLGV